MAAEMADSQHNTEPAAEQSAHVAEVERGTAEAPAAGNIDAVPHSNAVPPVRTKRKKRRPAARTQRQPSSSVRSSSALHRPSAIVLVAASAAVVGCVLLLRRLRRLPAAGRRQQDGSDGLSAADKQAARHCNENGRNAVDVPVVGAPPALVKELDPPLRAAAAPADGRRLLDGLTFAVSDVYASSSPPSPRHGSAIVEACLTWDPCSSTLVPVLQV